MGHSANERWEVHGSECQLLVSQGGVCEGKVLRANRRKVVEEAEVKLLLASSHAKLEVEGLLAISHEVVKAGAMEVAFGVRDVVGHLGGQWLHFGGWLL